MESRKKQRSEEKSSADDSRLKGLKSRRKRNSQIFEGCCLRLTEWRLLTS